MEKEGIPSLSLQLNEEGTVNWEQRVGREKGRRWASFFGERKRLRIFAGNFAEAGCFAAEAAEVEEFRAADLVGADLFDLVDYF